MAARHQVTCITPDGADADQRIDAIGGATGAANGGPWKLPIDQAIAGIENGTYQFWTYGGGKAVDVVVAKRPNGRKYLKTTADGVEPNNLLSLLTCN
ncbi:DUF3892 domain-containing protein [Phenylobacterium sp. LjRoot219]|uniref:DUF3892 domain-containing protein n=1 Tax=Phenylobacterium sp. LjRoot219 TaxID=3342283 RepID=UPI003ECC30C9